MSLENFQLPSFLITELYRDSLVDLDNEQVKSESIQDLKLSFLGENKKKVLILVDDKAAAFLDEKSLKLLIKILSACKLTIADTALFNIHNKPQTSYQLLMQEFEPLVIIGLGIDISSLEFPMQFPDYQVQKYNGQVYLSAPSLVKLLADETERAHLWSCLQKIFLNS